MSDYELSDLAKQHYSFLNPVIKANQLSMAVTEALVYFHLYVLESHVNMVMPQVKEAAAVSDWQSWRAFLTHQTETLSDLYFKSLEDNRMLSDLATHLSSRLDRLVQENLRLFSNQSLWRYKSLINPVLTADTLYNAMLEACVDLHLRALEAHTKMLTPQSGEITATASPQDWKAFLLHQDQAIAEAYQKFLSDVKALSHKIMRLQVEFDKLIEESAQFANPLGLLSGSESQN